MLEAQCKALARKQSMQDPRAPKEGRQQTSSVIGELVGSVLCGGSGRILISSILNRMSWGGLAQLAKCSYQVIFWGKLR